jgi:DUF4097 and DUF4098 domain-containing protein YvlB
MRQSTVIAAVILSLVLFSNGFAGPEQDKGTTKTFSVGKGGRIEVTINAGSIKISGSERDEVSIKIGGADAEDLARVEITQDGNTIRVRDRSTGSSDMWVSAAVPSRFDVNLKTAGGDLQLEGPLSGDLRGSTSGGDIHLGTLGGKLKMSTSGGDIKAGDFDGDLSLNTSGGDITTGNITGEGDIATSGGEIRIENVGKALKATTSGGEIKTGNVGGDVKLSTAGGDVQVGEVKGNARLSTAGGNIELRGANGAVSAKTAGGNLALKAITGSVEGSTAGGDIDTWLNPVKDGPSTLSTAGGNIRLQLPESAQCTINARIRLDERHSSIEQYDIRSDFKIENLQKDSREIRGTVNLNGGGRVITLETVMGNIDIRKGK